MSTKPLTPLGLAFVFAVLLAGWASAANGLQGVSPHRSLGGAPRRHARASALARSSGTKSVLHKKTHRRGAATTAGPQPSGSTGLRATTAAPSHHGKSHSFKHSKAHGKKSHHGGDGQDESGDHGRSHGGGHGHRDGDD